MSDEMSLPGFVSGYARYYGIDIPEAAYSLHELINELYLEYSERQMKQALPDHIFWVGRVDSSRRSIRKYRLFFGGIMKYLDTLYDPVPIEGYDLIPSYSVGDNDGKEIPVKLIYLSRKALAEWIEGAGVEVPDYILLGDSDMDSKVDEEGEIFQAKEKASISLIISGLVNIIKELDKAHAEQPVDGKSAKRADAIKRRAAGLRSSRKNFDVCSTILALAEAAETDMPKSHKTLKKYMVANFHSGIEESA